MPPATPQPAPNNQPAPAAPQWPTPPAMPPTPSPVSTEQPAFSLGAPGAPAGQQPQPTPPAPDPNEPPAWAKQFMTDIDERLNDFETQIAPPEPGAPIGSTGQPQPGQPQAPAQSELMARNPQSWADVENFVNEKIQQGVQSGIQGFQNDIQTQAQQEQKAKQEVDQALDAAVANLEQQGYLPPIANPNDSNDPGRVARRELYGVAAKLGTTDLNAVATTVLPVYHAQGKMYDPITDSLIDANPAVPGRQAPIGSSTATTGMGPNRPTYEQIHKARSLTELRERAGV